MILPHGLRRLALTAHIAASVGWLGAVAAFLPLAVAGVTSRDAETVVGAYLAMELVGWYALVPLALAALATGVVQGLVTPWGLLRHYWVVVKLLVTLVATVILLAFMGTLGAMADVAGSMASPDADLRLLRNPTAVLHAGLALLALLLNTTLSVYKPAGVTPYGRRKQAAGGAGRGTPGWVRAMAIGALVLLLVLAMLLAGRGDHGPGRHSGPHPEALA